MTTIPQGNLAEYKIPLPPKVEQERIAHALSTLDCKVDAEKQRAEALGVLFNTLLHVLMTARLPVDRLIAELA